MPSYSIVTQRHRYRYALVVRLGFEIEIKFSFKESHTQERVPIYFDVFLNKKKSREDKMREQVQRNHFHYVL